MTNLAIVLLVLADAIVGGRSIRQLKDIASPADTSGMPPVSLIVAARNEERNIEAGVRSLLALEYENLELIVVNDRSTDATGEVLQRVAAEHPELNVVHLTELPEGWLGKNHALHYGTMQAKGDWLLFTDADVVMAPSTLARAMKYVQEQQLDHLCIAPRPVMP
ncbi:MAG: glycosyltransferase, partial [Planctomycetes bacterium]|nr:glycosyltransferase [Planctomycetota bacterium]